MTNLLERRKQLSEVGRRNWHLWVFGLGVGILLALATASFFHPAIRRVVDRIEMRYGVLPQLILVLLALVLLSALYVTARQRELQEMRSFIIEGFAEAERRGEAFARDLLTGALDRRTLPDILKLEGKRADRYGITLCLVLFDIRGFSTINEKEGHMAGDAVLKDLAQTLRGTVRQIDIVLRYGPDEFLCLLPATEGRGGEVLTQRVVKACQQENRLRELTLDYGLAVYQPGEDIEAVMTSAERDLTARKGTPATLPEDIDVLLECARCSSREMAKLTADQYRELAARSSLIRVCTKCGVNTDWKFGFVEGEL